MEEDLRITRLKSIIEEKGLTPPCRLQIGLHGIRDFNHRDGAQKRYYKVYLGGEDVTTLLAGLANEMDRICYAADNRYKTFRAVGCGMDMAFYTVYTLSKANTIAGEQLIDGQRYTYLGKMLRSGKYEYE